MRKEARNLTELKDIASEVLASLGARESEGALVVGLSGDLGAGKTAFTKCVAELLGVTDTVTSPTFILEKIYPVQENTFFGGRIDKLVHIDAYRLDTGDDMRALDWRRTVEDRGALVLLEWPEQVKDALPSSLVMLSFEYVGEGVRAVSGDMIA